MAEPQFAKYPELKLAQQIFTISNSYSSSAIQAAALVSLQDAIKSQKMAPLYRQLAHPIEGILNLRGESSVQDFKTPRKQPLGIASMLCANKSLKSANLPWDSKLYEQLKSDNDEELGIIQKEEDEALEKAGETEIQAARVKRAEFWARVCDKEKAIASYELVFEKASILGTKIDLVFALIRIGLFFNDKPYVSKSIARAHTLVESGGDWDRRNRLKAYQGLHLLTVRSYSSAAPLLLDSLSTFTSYELCTYSSLIVYSVLAGSVALKRVDFKTKVVDAPEIKAVIGSGEDKLATAGATFSSELDTPDLRVSDVQPTATPLPAAINLTTLGQAITEQQDIQDDIDFSPLSNVVNSLYTGNYKSFFRGLGTIEQTFLCTDRYLAEHRAWFIREMRLKAYRQLLQSYRVVGLDSMAKEFGVTVDFLDSDLKNFIAAERISCTVDRVNCIIETNRPDEKNRQYTEIVKQGDQLITKLQKYGQTVRLKEG